MDWAISIGTISIARRRLRSPRKGRGTSASTEPRQVPRTVAALALISSVTRLSGRLPEIWMGESVIADIVTVSEDPMHEVRDWLARSRR